MRSISYSGGWEAERERDDIFGASKEDLVIRRGIAVEDLVIRRGIAVPSTLKVSILSSRRRMASVNI